MDGTVMAGLHDSVVNTEELLKSPEPRITALKRMTFKETTCFCLCKSFLKHLFSISVEDVRKRKKYKLLHF